jgi:putative transposase
LLLKLGWLRYRYCRCVLGTVKNVTVNLSCYKWIVPIQTEQEVEPPIANGGLLRLDAEASAIEIPRI